MEMQTKIHTLDCISMNSFYVIATIHAWLHLHSNPYEWFLRYHSNANDDDSACKTLSGMKLVKLSDILRARPDELVVALSC